MAHRDMGNSTGTVFWITGLSATGKTTVGSLLAQNLQAIGRQAIFLDGDRIRNILGNHFGYSRAERLQLAKTYASLCLELSTQGFDVVCATISLFHEIHQWNRKNIPLYREIYLVVPEEELLRRSRDKAGGNWTDNIVGIDIPAEIPLAPDLIIPNHGTMTPEKTAEKITKLENVKC